MWWLRLRVIFLVADGSRLGQCLGLVRFFVEANGWHKMRIFFIVYLKSQVSP